MQYLSGIDETINLKPCRHCGKDDAVMLIKHPSPGISPLYSVRCARCGAYTLMMRTEVEAAEVWNRRPKDES